MNVVEGFSEFSWRLSELYFRHLFGGHLKETASANRNMESETRNLAFEGHDSYSFYMFLLIVEIRVKIRYPGP